MDVQSTLGRIALMEDIRKTVGRNVRLARKAFELSQEALAHEAKIDRTYVSGVERGLRNPSIKVLERLAKALKTTPAALLTSGHKFEKVQTSNKR